MNVTQPSLRLHKASGQWITKWAGKVHYFGKDKAAARQPYLESMVEYAKWQAEKARARPIVTGRRITCGELYHRFIAAKEREVTPYTVAFYRGSLRRFIEAYETIPAAVVRPANLQGFKQDLLDIPLAKKTVNHELGAIKTMLQWGMDLELIPAVNLRGVKVLRLAPPPPKGYSLAEMRMRLKQAPPQLKPWIAVNWLTVCRPSETVRIVQQEGDWVEPWLFRPHQAKTPNRHIVFSPKALKWLKQCEPVFSRLDTYSRCFQRHCDPGGPHPLRHGAASRLHQLGVDRATVDRILGHAISRVSLTYAQESHSALRAPVARLSL